jgi:hypothetical protein
VALAHYANPTPLTGLNIDRLSIKKLHRVFMSESDLPRFTDNFNRLLGLHGLSQHFTAQLLGVSEATMSFVDEREVDSVAGKGDRYC